jgi:hypothetical protein
LRPKRPRGGPGALVTFGGIAGSTLPNEIVGGGGPRARRCGRTGSRRREGGAMNRVGMLLCAYAALTAAPARANLCDSVNDATTTAETKRDVDFYQQLFPDPARWGNRTWDEIVLQCNRQRDTKGKEIAKATATAGTNADKELLAASDLPPKVIRGHFNFFGTVVTQQKYVYVLSKENGAWRMIIPYRPILNDLVKDRVDLFMGRRDVDTAKRTVGALEPDGLAWDLYDTLQVAGRTSAPTLVSTARPIAETLCATTTFFEGKERKYDGQNDANAYRRDPENKFVSLGKLQYAYRKSSTRMYEGCRVEAGRELWWRPDPASAAVVRTTAREFVFDNFVRTAEEYWTVPGVFTLDILMEGRNDGDFPESIRNLLRDGDHLTVRFATRFPAYQFNQMYKSNPVEFNNFSTMTTDGSYWHEVGHAFGLDDEYAGDEDGTKKGDCHNATFAAFTPTTYQMCEGGVEGDARTIYHYLAVSRYVTKQQECQQDHDCGDGFYCNQGVDLKKNSCVALKIDGDACDLASGGRQCASGQCRMGHCYTPASVAMGGTCFVDDACEVGRCSSVDGTKGTCVCKKDDDCDDGQWCDGGLDTKRNACQAKLAAGAKCGKAGSVGNDHKCVSGECSGFPKYACK